MPVQITFCRDDFWDSNLTWYSESPNFTDCFQQLILEITPCLCFLLVSTISLIASWNRTVTFCLPWTCLNVSKLVLAVALLCISVVQLGFAIYQKYKETNIPDIDLYTASAKCGTFVIVIMVMIRNRDTGQRSCTILTLFWFFMCVCNVILLRSTILGAFFENPPSIMPYQYITDILYVPVLLCQFALSLFQDKTTGIPLETKCPFEDSPFFSFIFLEWFTSIVMKGRKKLLTLEDFPPLPFKLDAAHLYEKFHKEWSKEIQKYNSMVAIANEGEEPRLPRLPRTLLKSYWPWILYSSILQIVDDFSMFISPLVLDRVLHFIETDDYDWKGYLYCVALFASDFMSRIAYTFMTYYSQSFALQLRTCLFCAVYRKSLRLSNTSRSNYTTGEIVNFMSVDVEKIYNFATYCTFIFGAPIKILLTIFFLWMYLGPSCMSGVVILIVMIVISTYASKRVNDLQEAQMETKDERLKFMSEVLNGIKVLKLYAWELPFMKRISAIRTREVYLIRSFQMFYAFFSFTWSSASFLVAIASFVTYIFVDPNHVLSPKTVFVSLNLLNILRFAVLEVPELLADLIQTKVSVRRLASYLASEELSDDEIGDAPDHGEVVSVRNASLSWNKKGNPTLKKINFHVPQGSLVAIVGPVGSGKSSLLSAILGEMYKFSGSLDVKGTIAYVPQQAWVLNQTVRDNILFVKQMARDKYESVLDSCCLRPDLEVLPAGDSTEIGEKGVNLSGGQKQRISLARAVYSNSEIYLLDDPLSAVDAHVGKHIFDNVIGKDGLLKNKSRILVTHSITVLPYVDFIVTMKDGEIQEVGTYKELMQEKSYFAELIQEHLNTLEVLKSMESPEITAIEEKSLRQTLARRSISIQSVERTISVDSKIVEGGKLTDDEYMEVGEVKRETFIAYLKNMSLRLASAVFFGYLGHQMLDISGNVWLSHWTSDPPPVNGTQDISLRNMRIAVYAVLGFGQSIAIVVGCVSLAVASARASRKIHETLLSAVMHARMVFFDTTPLGRIMNRFGRDMEEVDTGIPTQIDSLLFCFFSVVGTLFIISINTPLFLPFLIPLGILYYLVQKLYLITSRQLKRHTSTTCSPLYSYLTETIQGVSSINAYNVSEHFIRKAEYKVNTNCLCLFLWNSCARWLDIRLSALGDIVIFLTAILAVTSRHHLSASLVGLSVTYALSMTDILTWLIRTGTEVENKSISLERISEYSKTTPEAPWVVPDTSPSPLWPQKGNIVFNEYSTRYRENLDLVLNNVNFEILENEKVGIVGRTGAGKSSITLALFRIVEPVTGTINIDNVDVSKIGLHQLREKLTIIPQDPVLFTGSLRSNLDPNEVHTDEELWWSLERANLKTFVSSLPDALIHDVTEGGNNLSVGQRQLVCLARALLKKTKILILDEATAAVDVETDRMIQNTIRTEFKDHTVLTIAHRLNTIVDYDKVLVMDAGKVSEFGKPTELMRMSNTKFHSMAKDAGLL